MTGKTKRSKYWKIKDSSSRTGEGESAKIQLTDL